MTWKELPAGPGRCLEILTEAGWAAYPVGGWVRDLLLGREPGDVDVCTAARPETVLELFPSAVPTGLKHGTVTVPTADGAVEITTFRRETGYADGRHPDAVIFDAGLTEDLARRDFTINAMALAEDGTVIDPFGGREDLERRRIRCVGEPGRRFGEDALRMFRAVRFAAQLGFDWEENTAAAIRRQAPLAARLSAERVRVEVEKTLLSPRPGLAGAFFELGLMAGLPAQWPEGAFSLTRLPAQGLERWAGLCACLLESGIISDCAAFLSGMKLDRRTVRACRAGEVLWRTGLPGEAGGWRRALSRCGAEACRAAAAMGAVTGVPAAPAALEKVLAGDPCVAPAGLALSGGDLAALGYSGPEVGRAQRRLLDHVLDMPEDNTRERLLALLKSEENCDRDR
ncbi:MAG: tRNA nucleotidyltransferase [Clostridiales bacterium]|nr:tRNA nucleotidyltransferase [Clostridiales bacterium]